MTWRTAGNLRVLDAVNAAELSLEGTAGFRAFLLSDIRGYSSFGGAR